MRRLRVGILSVVMTACLLATAATAYAYGIQRHTVSSFFHGCNADPGCYGSTNRAGDYNKEGITWQDSRVLKDYFYTGVWSAETGGLRVHLDCSNCWIIGTAYDTNPKWECDFKTWHVVVNNSVTILNGHWHWTEAATSSSGC